METVKELQGIIAFVRTAETGSFSNAAQELGVSKSHISKSIARLEDTLGVSLLLRSTRRIQLTAWGEKYLETCKQAIANLDSAKREIRDSSETPGGSLRITLAGVFGEEYVAPVVIEMAKKYPNLKVEMDFSTRVVDLIAEKFDVAIRIGELKDSSLVAQKIGPRFEYVVASKAYLAGAAALDVPEDLAHHNCLGERLTWGFRRGGRALQVSVGGNFKSNNPRVIQKAALSGLGVARLPASYVNEDLKRGRLVSLLENFSEGRKDIWVVTPARRAPNINVKIFVKEMKRFLSEEHAELYF
ncbi:MAG: LysR family transcriptional regulator [Bdellovibrionaceae bacterium]|nr:LysR family transcriptional regulator [Pseudobdellovibrionaceae bacterium]